MYRVVLYCFFIIYNLFIKCYSIGRIVKLNFNSLNQNLIYLVLIFFKRDNDDLNLYLLLASSNGEGSTQDNNNPTTQNQENTVVPQNQSNPVPPQNQNNPVPPQNQNNPAPDQDQDSPRDDSCDGYESDNERLGISSEARTAERYDYVDLERLHEDELRKAAQVTADRCRNIRQR